MGDRGSVLIKDNKVFLYTHWNATNLPEIVERAIAKKWRWGDPDYLTRIIFDTMTEEQHGEETGYGIGTQKAGDIWRLVTVDCKKQTVTVQDEKYTGGESSWHVKSKKTFSEIAGIGATN